jgi:hypothetical protein
VSAILAAINAQFTTTRAYLYGDPVIPSLTTDHILVSVTRRYTEGRMVSGDERVRGGRVTTRYVSKRADNIYPLRKAVESALEAETLPLSPSGEVGPFVFESSEPPGPDDGWVTGDDFWTY